MGLRLMVASPAMGSRSPEHAERGARASEQADGDEGKGARQYDARHDSEGAHEPAPLA
jgi:hypothetical protein